MALKQIGMERVWVLEGGLTAWREQGLPLSRSLEIPEVVAERFWNQIVTAGIGSGRRQRD
jgi:3-mercaptopyruvate sulfurtransferase SseA